MVQLYWYAMKPLSVPAVKFKAQCLALLDEVERTSRPIIVTKRGRPVAQVAPLPARKRPKLKGSIVFQGDLVSPLDEIWDADRK